MSSAPTIKDLTKAVNNFVPIAKFPLPDDLVEIIDAYLCKHEKFDESAADKLNDELLSLFHKDVSHVPSRYTAFVALLRRLRPIVGQPDKIFQWFDLLLLVLNYLNQEKDLAAEVEGTILDILTADDGHDSSSPTGGAAPQLAERILLLWLDEYETIGKSPDAISEFKEKQMQRTLLHYGKRRPKDLLTVLDQYVAKKTYRARALSFLAFFVQSQPPHLHLILQTPLFNNLINCLQIDTSTTIVSLALTALTMILPHMPSSLVPHLPTLFNIYARLLFWERELSSQVATEIDQERRLSPNTLAWEKLAYSPDFDDTAIPQLLHYFTILYGLYPINFMDYIRKPQRYLRHAEVPDADDIEVQPTEIRDASERFRQCHLLHENFYTLTIDSEKDNFGRWIKSEPSEVVADCVALCQAGEALPNQGIVDAINIGASEKDEPEKDGHDSALLSGSYPFGVSFSPFPGDNRRNTGSTFAESITSSRKQSVIVRQSSIGSYHSNRDVSSPRPSGLGNESPTLSRQLVQSGSQTQLQDLINSNKVIKSGLHQSMANDSVPSLALSHHDSISDRQGSQLQPSSQLGNTSSPTDSISAQIAHLQRQILLLYNDLTFERFMKQQHLTHMGALRRRHVREAASEAETQNLIIQNRQLKQRLKDAKDSETQAKKESEKSRTLSKKWEADLTTKLRGLREEQKKWNAEGDTLRTELDAAKGESERLRLLVCEAEVRELDLKQNMQSVEINVGELVRLREEVQRLAECERNYHAKETERQNMATHAAEAEGRAEMLEMKLKAHDSDIQKTHEMYKSQIAELNARLQGALKTGTGHRSEALKTQLENTLAANREQQTELKNRIAEVTRKNSILQATILELQSTISSLSKPDPHPSADTEVDFSSDSGSPLGYRNRQHRGFSEPDMFEATSYNPTPPLEPYSSVGSAGSQGRRPSTPLQNDPLSAGKGSPTTERYFGRGGVQNLRKEKEKKKEEKEKKKSTGLRGIRGFV
ncbi:Hamartin protein-domain-containing protein [Annulohypoxylon maeteangense]|uniref:Hamartin protein-domain-containing protein n=1 Tax=Annulohypoxylon maeteangense TaxID=1927788 RepID=UPI0020073D82|nr:Hamartin protein-domain-containing protein [Annulohypoxylon maeteangense]KAI0888944.1 Hamartin protein-domain-containing protein [Annulohypoxylon maeteangense]